MKLLLVAAMLTLTVVGCRTDKPPAISIVCGLDGSGGADCVQADGTKVHLAPSQLLNFWATTQTDIANYTSWCYKVPTPVVSSEMMRINEKIFAGRAPADPVEPQPLLDQRGDHAE